MSVFLAYVDAVPGRLFPLVPTFRELQRRGHRVAVRCGVNEVGLLRSIGVHAAPLAPEIERFEPDDWRARTRFGALSSGLRQFGERAHSQVPDLRRAIENERPDALLIDEGAWGAAAAAERSGLPWAFSIVSSMPLPSRDAPPFGLGLAPRSGLAGRARDRFVRTVALGALERMIGAQVDPVRAAIGLAPVRSLTDLFLAAHLVLAYTAEPFEYPRSDWPTKVRLVGPGLWEPPAEPPVWLEDMPGPLVLVSCSTLFQNDGRIAAIACEAFEHEPFDVIVTTADADRSGLRPPANVRIERFVPHSAVLERASCVVCHAGMGTTQKALAHAVPVVPSRSAAINPRSLVASRWLVQASGCRSTGSMPIGFAVPSAARSVCVRAPNGSPRRSPGRTAQPRRRTHSRSSCPAAVLNDLRRDVRMRLTWRDGVASVLALAAAAVAVAVLEGWDWPLLGSYRAGTVALGVIGLAMCGVGGYEFWNAAATQPRAIAKDAFLALGSASGAAVMVVLAIGLIAGTREPFAWMVVLMGALWVLTTAHHAVEQAPRGARPAMGAT